MGGAQEVMRLAALNSLQKLLLGFKVCKNLKQLEARDGVIMEAPNRNHVE